jgi:hypothetical protein
LFEIAHRNRDVVDHSVLLAAMAVVLNPGALPLAFVEK